MLMSLPQLLSLSIACAPTVAPETLLAVVRAESGFDPLAIGVNGAAPRRLHPASPGEALALARRLAASGADFDLGLGQINRRTLGRLGLSLADALDPCLNLAAAAEVLAADYAATRPDLDRQAALRAALSRYNTGDETRGLRNGYVRRVSAAADYVVPAIRLAAPAAAAAEDASPGRSVTIAPAGPEPAAWDVFARARSSPVMVFAAAPEHRRRPSPTSRLSPSGAPR